MRIGTLVFVPFLLEIACGKSTSQTADIGSDANSLRTQPVSAVEPVVTKQAATQPTIPDMITIPAGEFRVGSAPTTSWRRARDEADLQPVRLEAFSIDRLPYPNDPTKEPRTNVSFAQATDLCAQEGKRLCSELEWERACKGTNAERLFPSGAHLSLEECDNDIHACESPEHVLQMGILFGEWTMSPGTRGLSPETRIFRGSEPRPEELHRHRCAARRAAIPTTESPYLGFRCCSGPQQNAQYPDESQAPRFRRLNIEIEEVRAMLRNVPDLRELADAFVLEDEESMAATVTRSGGSLRGWELAGGILQWSPRAGDSTWVITGRSHGHSILVIFYRLADETFLHGQSLLLLEEDSSIAVAFTPPSRHEIQWSSCWGCPGEGGTISLQEDGTLAILYR